MQERFEERPVSEHIIRIDRTLCIGTGSCVQVAPEVFVLGNDQIVTFVDEPEDVEPDRLVDACAVCPVDALIAIDPAGEQLVPPEY